MQYITYYMPLEEIIENLNLGPLIKHQAHFYMIKGNPSIVKTLLFFSNDEKVILLPEVLEL